MSCFRMNKVNTIISRVCSVLMFLCAFWQLYIFEIMRRLDNLGEAGFPDATGSFELLGSAKYFVLAFAVICLFWGVSVWRWKDKHVLWSALSTVVALILTYIITVSVVVTAYAPVLEQAG